LGVMLSVLTVTVYARTQDTAEAMATYTVTFASTWSADTHPGFPANAHFSALIGATHTVSATFWLSGTLASAGIEQMAETGGTSRLRSEFAAAGAAVQQIITGPALSTSPAQVALPALTVSQSHPLVTLVTMIAPSPDWFVGVHDLALLDEAGDWRDEIVVTLYPYDAGTDDGVNYTSPDAEPAVHQVIRQLSGQPPFSTAPIGTLTFTRVQQAYLPIVTQ
jgi:hypothetical protein